MLNQDDKSVSVSYDMDISRNNVMLSAGASINLSSSGATVTYSAKINKKPMRLYARECMVSAMCVSQEKE